MKITPYQDWINVAIFIFDHAIEQGRLDHLESLDDLSACIRRGDSIEVKQYECNFAGECDDSEEFIILTGINACLDLTPFWDAINPITRAVELLGYPANVVYVLLGRA